MKHIKDWPMHLNNGVCIPLPESEERRFWSHLFSCDRCRRKLTKRVPNEGELGTLPEFWEEVDKYLQGFHPEERGFLKDMKTMSEMPYAWAQLALSGLLEVPEKILQAIEPLLPAAQQLAWEDQIFTLPPTSEEVKRAGRSFFHFLVCGKCAKRYSLVQSLRISPN